ncbi:MAG: glycosyltransferase family 2 protein [Bacteroidota bacterium]
MINYLKSFISRKAPHYISICCIIKDENNYLDEWVNYHLKVGVQHFYIYDNGSTIPVQDTLQKLDLLKYVTVINFPGVSMQYVTYKHCLKKYGMQSRWIAFIDTDEFIVPKTTHGDLRAFLKDYEGYGGLGINWLMFGSAGYVEKTGRPQLESFVLRSDDTFDVNKHIKSIIQPKYTRKVFDAHSFKYIKWKFCVNEHFVRIPKSFSPVSTDKIQLNHYFCRSLAEYHEKIKRGRSDDASITRSVELFHEFDRASNKVEDTTILTFRDHPVYTPPYK